MSMQSGIFIIDRNDSLARMEQSSFATEDDFQALLAHHPELLAALAGDGSELTLVSREAAVPADQSASRRWSLDHLFLDQKGVPVLVEVKRASDTRARREVVAQALEYAANAVAYWPVEMLRSAFEESARGQGADADEALAAFLGAEEASGFWPAVEANLRAGRIRIAIVADAIPAELRRIIEFLNEQMRPAEMLAVEIEHHTAENGLRLLIPRLIGRTARSEGAKSTALQTKPTSLEEWLSDLEQARGAAVRKAAEKVLDWSEASGLQTTLTSSGDAIAIHLRLPNGKVAWPFFIRASNGKLETSLKFLAFHTPYTDDAARQELLGLYKSIPQIAITTAKNKGTPAIPLGTVSSAEVWAAWTSIASRIIQSLKA